jgi:hypothetical protein
VSGSSTADVGVTKITSNPRRLVYVVVRGDLVSFTDRGLLNQGLFMITAHLPHPIRFLKKRYGHIFS